MFNLYPADGSRHARSQRETHARFFSATESPSEPLPEIKEMQLHAAQHPKADTTKNGRHISNSPAAGSDRHSVKIRMGSDGFSFEVESSNSVLIFAIALILILMIFCTILLLN